MPRRTKRESRSREIARLHREQKQDQAGGRASLRSEGHASLTFQDDASGDAFVAMFQHTTRGRHPIPLSGHGLSMSSLATVLRVRHCLDFIPEEQAALLWQHLVERRTLEELAKDRKSSKQAVFQRVETARRALVRAIADHWNDPLDLDKLPVQAHNQAHERH